MAYPWCGECANCRTLRQSYCLNVRRLKQGGTRADGSEVVLKIGWPHKEAETEAAGLRFFAGQGAVRPLQAKTEVAPCRNQG